MKSSVVFSGIVAIALSSCSAVYKTAQTPDDVYYSPGREANESYAQIDRQQRDGSYRVEDIIPPEDRVLRMRVRNPALWSAFDDYGYGGMGFAGPGFGYGGFNYGGIGYGGFGYPGMGYGGLGFGGLGYGMGYPGMGYGGLGFGYGFPYYGGGLGLGLGYNNFYNNYYGWNSMFNPYYGGSVIVGKTPRANTRIRTFNPNTYTNRNYNGSNNSRPGIFRPSGRNGYNNTNRLGTSTRRPMTNSNRGDYYRPDNNRPVRTYTPPNNTQSTRSSGSVGGSTGGGRPTGGRSTGGRPGRGN